MVIDVRRYAIVFLIDIDDTTIRYTSWRKYMPPNQPFDYYFENRWHWINISTLKDSGWVSRFVRCIVITTSELNSNSSFASHPLMRSGKSTL
jgi:hypothetical protein